MIYYLSRGLLKLLYQILLWPRTYGLENIPKTGGVILAPNHISYLDPPAAGIFLRRQVHYMAKEELFKSRFLGKWMHKVGAFPVKRASADRRAIRRALELLEQGKVVCIFPEGTRSPDGNLQKAEMGIGLIALKSRVHVVPVAIEGTDKALPPHAKFPRFHRVTITYGTPITFPDLYDSSDSRKAIEEIGRRIISAISKLQNP